MVKLQLAVDPPLPRSRKTMASNRRHERCRASQCIESRKDRLFNSPYQRKKANLYLQWGKKGGEGKEEVGYDNIYTYIQACILGNIGITNMHKKYRRQDRDPG